MLIVALGNWLVPLGPSISTVIPTVEVGRLLRTLDNASGGRLVISPVSTVLDKEALVEPIGTSTPVVNVALVPSVREAMI